MQIRWSPEAADDFESAIRRILQDNPSNAQRLAQIIYDRIASLTAFPNRGRAGRIEGTRELGESPHHRLRSYLFVEVEFERAGFSQRQPSAGRLISVNSVRIFFSGFLLTDPVMMR